MADKLTHSKTISVLSIALGEKGYVAPPAPIVSQPRQHGKTSFMSAIESLAGVNRNERNYQEHHMYVHSTSSSTVWEPSPQERDKYGRHLVITVHDALTLAHDIVIFMQRNGPKSVERVVEQLTQGRGQHVTDLPENALPHFQSILRRG